MTNGHGQRATIKENILRKYGRYPLYRRQTKDDKKEQPDDPRIAVLQQVAPELLQDIHDRNNK